MKKINSIPAKISTADIDRNHPFDSMISVSLPGMFAEFLSLIYLNF